MFLRFLSWMFFLLFLVSSSEADSLIAAIKNNQHEEAERRITSGADLSEVDSDGNTPLMIAGMRNSKLVKLLLENGADPAAMNPQGFTVLHLLAGRMYIPDDPIYAYYREGYYMTASLIMDTGIDVEQRTSRGWTPLMLAARTGADDMIRLLVQTGADTETRDDSGKTALHYAAAALKTSSARALIEAGADSNAKDAIGRTPLMLCSEQQGDPILAAQVARVLLISKAKPDLQDDTGQTALMIAARIGNKQMERLLTGAGADQNGINKMRLFAALKANAPEEVEAILATTTPDARDDQGRTPLMIAVLNRNWKMVDFFLQHGADPNAEDNAKQTPLMLASNYGHGNPNLKILKQLIHSGARITAKDADGNTALAFAVETFFGDAEPVVKTLLDAKADPEATYFQQPVLLSAIRKRDPVISDLLLRAGANPNTQYEKTTPLAIAVQTEQPEMVLLLLKYQALDASVMQQANEMVHRYADLRQQIEKKVAGELLDGEIVLTRTACDGNCPVYTLKIQTDGKVEYRGEKNVALTGTHRSKIEIPKIREILRKAYLSGFFDTEETGGITSSDSGDVIISITVESNSRTLTSRDADLDLLGRTIDRVAETRKWISASPDWILAHSSDPATLSTHNLVLAILAGRTEVVEALLQAGCDPNTSDESGESILVLSARNRKLPILELLFRYGAYPDPRALIAAAEKDDKKTLEYLLDHGLSARGLSLHSLAKDASGEIVDLLARGFADLSSKDENGNTPLILAAGYRNYDMVETLLRHRLDPNVANKDGLTPLLAAMSDWEYPYSRWFAGSRDSVAIAELLLRSGANPNSFHSKTGKSALSVAISRRDYFLVRLLRKAGANPDLETTKASSPLRIARQLEFSEILKLIQQ